MGLKPTRMIMSRMIMSLCRGMQSHVQLNFRSAAGYLLGGGGGGRVQAKDLYQSGVYL